MGGMNPEFNEQQASAPSPAGNGTGGWKDREQPAAVAAALLEWYDGNRRVLPWRALPGSRGDPYRVWISEIMLQQTVAATVIPYFERFTMRWPTIEALAAAALDDVLVEWAGLGYYARARNLHRCAQVIVERFGGIVPPDREALLSLPGIGAYTAGAIAAIAYDRAYAAVDGNVERVVSRLAHVTAPLPASRPLLRSLAGDLVPSARAGDFAQAMMDLGATVCVPSTPRCMACPVSFACEAFRIGGCAASSRQGRQGIQAAPPCAVLLDDRRKGTSPGAPPAATRIAGRDDGNSLQSLDRRTSRA